tara:strand:- start:451 stop:1224 length:774 start_codon:yes stop_codon:yes gene_type:complete
MSEYINHLYNLKNKVVLITGSSGQLGSALCKSYLDLGSIVIGIDNLKPSKGIKNVNYFIKDVSNEKGIQNLFEEIYKKFGSIDILINNAGVSIFSPFQKRTNEELDFVIDTNLKGSFYFIKEFSNFSKSKNSNYSNIVNIASMYGVISPDFRIYSKGDRKNSEIYGATKAAIIQMTKYFAVHLAERKIRVNCVSPGGIFNQENPQSDSFIKNYSFRCPLNRMANVKEIIGGIIFLSSDAASYVTGQNLIIDGGMSCW